MAKKHKKALHGRGAQQTGDLSARAKHYKLKPHHTKPYRKRHFGLLVIAAVFLLAIVFQAGFMLGASNQDVVQQQAPTPAANASLKNVVSSYGYSLSFDGTMFGAKATAIDAKGAGQTVPDNQLDANQQINLLTLRPKTGTVRAVVAASQFSVQVLPGTAEFDTLAAKSENTDKPQSELAAQLMPITSGADFDVTKLSSTSDTLGDGTLTTKSTYQFVSKSTGGTSYAVVWNGVVKGHPFAVKLAGLINASTTPSEYEDIFATLKFEGQKVQGISFLSGQAYAASNTIDSKYLSDTISPAVLKIYHIVCGELVVGSVKLEDDCMGMSGSGFLVSSDGYIATNGHVVVQTAKDIFVQIVTSSPQNLVGFLRSIGLSDDQIVDLANDPQQLASVIAKIYDVSDEKIFLNNPREVTLVALGKDPLTLTEGDSIDKLLNYEDSETMKRAEIIGSDYSGKDLLVAQSGDPQGFSSSDVALLKVKVSDAPVIGISAGQVTQNEKITVLGFPGDAENSLVDNSTLDVSVTNGSISAIKEAAGGKGKLYQSDADASHGNSGGPAVNDAGEAFGLLTYRVAGDDQGNAAKSYMRDINDFSKLAKDKNVTFNTTSKTQQAWAKGMELYSKNHFSAAKKEFAKVKTAYPAHRLVKTYIENADKQIAAGNDVKLFPVALLIGAAVLALAGVAVAVVLIIRHKTRHQAYVSQTPPGAAGPPAPPAAPVAPPSAPVAPTSFQQPPTVAVPAAPLQPQAPPPPLIPVYAQPPAVVPTQPAQQARVMDQIIAAPPQQPALGQPLPPSMTMPSQQPTVITPTIIRPQ